jgi:hypothetical protein
MPLWGASPKALRKRKKWGLVTLPVSGGTFGKEQREWGLTEIIGKLVQDAFAAAGSAGSVTKSSV